MFVLPTRPPAEVGSHAVFCLEEPRPALETVVRVMRLSIIEAESAPLSHGVGLQFVSPSSATRAKLSRLAKSGREQD